MNVSICGAALADDGSSEATVTIVTPGGSHISVTLKAPEPPSFTVSVWTVDRIVCTSSSVTVTATVTSFRPGALSVSVVIASTMFMSSVPLI